MCIKKIGNIILILLILVVTSHCLRCLSCNSKFNENCPSNLNATATILCEEGDECVTFVDGNSVIYRGCGSEMDESINVYQTCNNTDLCNRESVCLNNPKCLFCDDENCENRDPANYHTCIECDSTLGQSCIIVDSNLQQVDCRNSHQTGCYHYEKGNTVKRGCLSHLGVNDSLKQECEKNHYCKTCVGNNCNIKEKLQTCFTCNSFENSNCATLKEDLPMKICDNYFDTCKVYVKPNSTTHRGCSLEIDDPTVECSPQTVNCKQCSENLCNGGIFPSNRISCYQCRGLSSSECSRNVKDDMIHPCEKFYFRDSCYLIVDKNNVTSRGCLSDSDFFSNLCQANPNECDVCQTSNCNMNSIMRPPKLNCIKCDTSTDPKCLWGFTDGSKTPCTKNVLHHQEESCFVFQVSNISLIRGCTLDSNVCKLSNSCSLCKEDGCNNEKKAEQYCIECTSEENEDCLNKPQNLKNVSCEGNITYEQRGCFTWTNEFNHVSRGCFSSLSTTKKFKCINDHEHCEICFQNDNCNTLPKSECNSLYSNINYIFFVTITILFNYNN
ncbi:uncharacterized protein [Chironomus tepperi]|uniref:uncharacterized protein n=1 Tax=Chironomus tepperi TaxID=113505 RepID=UPI00391EE8E7